MREYAQTFRRHLILYSLVPILAMVAVGYVAFSAPKKYESSAGLWVDNGPAAGSSLLSTSTSGDPASFEQGILNELLATSSFDLAVGEGSSLKQSVTGTTQRAKDGAIEAAVVAGAGSTTPGAQVLLVSFTGSSPEVAQSTVRSLIRQLQSATARYGQDYGDTATRYYQTQLSAANKARATARAALTSYRLEHPRSNSSNDTTYAQLSSALASASSQVSSITESLDEAQAEAKAGVQGATVRVVDAASLPTSPTKGKKKEAELVVGAGIGGALLSLLVVIGLTKIEEEPQDEEPTEVAVGLPRPRPRGLPLGSLVVDDRDAAQTVSEADFTEVDEAVAEADVAEVDEAVAEPDFAEADEAVAEADVAEVEERVTEAEFTAEVEVEDRDDDEDPDEKDSEPVDGGSLFDVDAPTVRGFRRSWEDREPV